MVEKNKVTPTVAIGTGVDGGTGVGAGTGVGGGVPQTVVTNSSKLGIDKKAAAKQAMATVYAEGAEIIKAMPEDEQKALGNAYGTLELINTLGLHNPQKSVRSKGHDKPSNVVVGYTFVSSRDVKVPKEVTPHVFRDYKSGKESIKVHYVPVKAGQKFDLTRIESALFTQAPEYSNMCMYKGVKVKMTYRMQEFMAHTTTLPTPSINCPTTGISPKDTLVHIEEMGEDKKWHIKDEYKASFGPYENREASPRGSSHTEISGDKKSMAVSAAMRKLFASKVEVVE